MRGIAAVALLSMAALAAQEAPKLGEVFGVVVDRQTQEPIRKALVFLSPRSESAPLATRTDAEGKFHLHSVQPGTYMLGAQKPGFVSPQDETPPRVEIAAGQQVKGLKVELLRGALVSGRVLDPDGDPAPSVQVHLVHVRKRSQAANDYRSGAATDENGEYRIRGIPPGKYRVQAKMQTGMHEVVLQRPLGQAGDVVAESPQPTYYPSTLELTQGAVIEVQPGARVEGIDIRVLTGAAHRIRGRVAGPSSGPQPQYASIQLTSIPRRLGLQHSALARGKGSAFEIQGVRPGRYLLHAQCDMPEGQALRAMQVIEVQGSDLDGVEVEVAPPIRLTGRVVLPEGKKAGPNGYVYLSPKDDSFEGYITMGQVARDGTFTIPDAFPGRYSIQLYLGDEEQGASSDLWLSAATQAGQDVLTNGLLVTRETVDPLLLKVEANGGAAAVVVQGDEQKPKGATVRMIPAGKPSGGFGPLGWACTVQESGGCRITGLPPGEYRVYLIPFEELPEFYSPEAFEEVEEQSKLVKIERGQTISLELKPVKLEP